MLRNDYRIKAIADHFGWEPQRNKAIEELAELTIALCNGDRDGITEEIADVEVMLAQVKNLLGIKDVEIDVVVEAKIDRTVGRIGIDLG